MRISPYRDTGKYAAHWTITSAKANTKVLGYFDSKLLNLSTTYSWWTFDKVVTVGACVNNECGTWVDIWRHV
ncbi:hypothetical protein H074_33669 [Amycolatopsis decaplanina DSM 44594]|uniref:Uncharacterized protein n=2 Tax=Amycolatopsis decaplanina TaxID=208441 RepID=M2YW40_9PSEU|nr:hypothetical protein H074_33669 [Amycolatopsis decaplanina DSM 44594]